MFPGKGHATRKGARKTYQIQNHNRLLLNYPGTTGIKNGYTSTAGASLVVSATRGGQSYVVAMLRSDPDVWHMGAHLLDWAFAQHGGAQPVGRLDSTPVPATAAPGATTSTSRNRSAPLHAAIPPVVAGPVRATLAAMPDGQRTALLLAVLALALVGGAVVRRDRARPRCRGLAPHGQAPDAGEARPHQPVGVDDEVRIELHVEAHDAAGPPRRAAPPLSPSRSYSRDARFGDPHQGSARSSREHDLGGRGRVEAMDRGGGETGDDRG